MDYSPASTGSIPLSNNLMDYEVHYEDIDVTQMLDFLGNPKAPINYINYNK